MTELKRITNIATLNGQVTYFIMDALYFMDLINYEELLECENFREKIKSELFPYCDFPFAEIKVESNSAKFKMKAEYIKRLDVGDIQYSMNHCFATDTGLMLFINESKLKEFVRIYNYGVLTTSDTEILNWDYWDSLTQKFVQDDVALLLAQDINSGLDFCGSGEFKIVMPEFAKSI